MTWRAVAMEAPLVTWNVAGFGAYGLAQDETEDGGLSCPILAHQGDLGALAHGKGRLVERWAWRGRILNDTSSKRMMVSPVRVVPVGF